MAVNHACTLPQGELGEEYVLYLLEDQEEQPVAVILPKDAAEQPLPATQEVLISIYFFQFNCRLFLPEAKCVYRQAAVRGYPLQNSPDPSKTKPTSGTVLGINIGSSQSGPLFTFITISAWCYYPPMGMP